MIQLPIFKGWTVDARLRQFRRIKKQSKYFAGMEYVEFDSDKGEKLLCQYIKSVDVNGFEFERIANAVL